MDVGDPYFRCPARPQNPESGSRWSDPIRIKLDLPVVLQLNDFAGGIEMHGTVVQPRLTALDLIPGPCGFCASTLYIYPHEHERYTRHLNVQILQLRVGSTGRSNVILLEDKSVHLMRSASGTMLRLLHTPKQLYHGLSPYISLRCIRSCSSKSIHEESLHSQQVVPVESRNNFVAPDDSGAAGAGAGEIAVQHGGTARTSDI